MKTVSLFSGIGGLDLGFINNGFDVIWAIDSDKYCVDTYRANISEHIILGDVNDYVDQIPQHDVLLAGFPCQPFSMMGKQHGFDDERGTLIFTIEEILKKYDSKIFVLENVKNLLTHNNGDTFKKIINIFEQKLNYKIFYQIVNSADYGVPQNRRRIFFVGFNKKYFPTVDFKFPAAQPLINTVQDLLDKTVDKKYFLSHKILSTVLSLGTKSYKAKPEIDKIIARPFTATMHKMHRASQDNYYTDNFNRATFHDDNISNIRRLTPNECRKLQGFPNDWKQVVSDTQAYKQFGNAVTVNVADAVAKAIVELMN